MPSIESAGNEVDYDLIKNLILDVQKTHKHKEVGFSELVVSMQGDKSLGTLSVFVRCEL